MGHVIKDRKNLDFFDRSRILLGVLMIALVLSVVIGLRALATVRISPNVIRHSCIAQTPQSIMLNIHNSSFEEVKISGVTSDCGCFEVVQDLPIPLSSGESRQIEIRYSCPAQSRDNLISVMVGGKVLEVINVSVHHSVTR